VEFSCRPAGGQRLRGFNQAGLRREYRVEGCVVNVISFKLSVVSPRIAIVKTTKFRRAPAHVARRASSAIYVTDVTIVRVESLPATAGTQ
jgi:hypothetical protein